MKQQPRITILLAAYKGAAYVGAQIESILAQSEKRWRLILSDDGSDTEAVLENYAKKNPERILHIKNGRRFGSAQKHFMYLLKEYGQDTPYVMFCDQDDVWHEDKIRLTYNRMRAEEAAHGKETPVLVHTDLRVVDDDLKLMNPSFLRFSKLDGKRLAFPSLLVQNVVTGCTVMINHALAEKAARAAQEEEQMMMHDWWLALMASSLGRAVFLPEATMDYRQHGDNQVGAKDAASVSYMLSRMKGGYARSMRDETIRQTEAFLALYGNEMSREDRRRCHAFINLKDQKKLARLRSISRNGFWKNTLARRLGQILWW